MSTYITITWGYRRQCQKVKTFCTKCKKKLNRVIDRGYYDNGFHNARETEFKNWEEIKEEAKKLEKTGTVCKNCTDTESGIPFSKRTTDGTGKYHDGVSYKFKRWEILSRGKTPKRLGIVREYNGGWAKYYITSPRMEKWRRYCRSLRDAAETVAQVINGK